MTGLLCSACALLGGTFPQALATRATEDARIPRGAVDAPARALVHSHQ